MTQNAAMRGEKIYDMELNITGVTDYGVSMDAQGVSRVLSVSLVGANGRDSAPGLEL